MSPAPLAVVSAISLGATVAAGAAVGALLLTMPEPPAHGVWFDEPLDHAELAVGEHDIVVHLDTKPTSLRLVITRNGSQVGSLVDVDFQAQPAAPDRVAWRADFDFTFDADGEYVIQPFLNGADDAARDPIEVQIGEASSPPPTAPAAAPTATPTPAPTSTPTPTATPSHTPKPSSTPHPTSTPTPHPTITIHPTPPPTIPPIIRYSGTVIRTQHGSDDWESDYAVAGISPSNATARIQSRVMTADGSTVLQDWQNWDCVPVNGTAAPWSCTVADVQPTGVSRTSSRMIQYRLELVYNGHIWTGPIGSWTTAPQIH